MKSVEAEVKRYEEKDQQGTGDAQRQPQHVDERVYFLPFHYAPGKQNVVSEHRRSLR